jgi:hypothetical protein
MAGCMYGQIAEQLHFNSASVARQAVFRAMKRLGKPEKAEQLRALELARLDRLFLAVWTAAVVHHDLGAVDRALKIMKRRAELLGLDAPSKHQMTGLDGGPIAVQSVHDLSDEELRAIAAQGLPRLALPPSAEALLPAPEGPPAVDAAPAVRSAERGVDGRRD